MRSAQSTTARISAVETGRHRLGRPHTIPVAHLVTVIRRGFFKALFRGPRHALPTGTRTVMHPRPVHATV